VPGGVNSGVFDDSSFSTKATAKILYNEMTKPRRDQNADDAHVKKFGANTFIRDTSELTDCIEKAS
jgi:hypothetical protein